MELKDLVGVHLLSGIDEGVEQYGESWERLDSSNVLFTLDGITYKAVEDPDDGYRSYLGDIFVSDTKPKFTFPPQEVYGRMMDDDDYSSNNVIQFIDTTTNLVVLAIGTENTDDWYPYCVIRWNPENLLINKTA